jgi:hypothetical protein
MRPRPLEVLVLSTGLSCAAEHRPEKPHIPALAIVDRAIPSEAGAQAVERSDASPTSTPMTATSAGPFDGSYPRSLPPVPTQSCKVQGGPTGAGHVTVTFAPSGEVIAVVVDRPPFAGTPVGECVAALFRTVRLPPFSDAGGSIKVGKSFVIN